MHFELSEKHRMFQKAMRALVEREVTPIVAKAEEEQAFPVKLFRRLGELGYLGIGYPEEYGGAAADKLTECIYLEELSKVSSGITCGIMSHMGVSTGIIYKYGSEEQRTEYLIPAIKGEKIGAFGLTEPNAGSDIRGIQTTARLDGDSYVLNGSKTLITNATIADFITVAAYLVVGEEKKLSIFVVDKDNSGIKTRKLKKMGNLPAETGEIVFEDCRIPKNKLIGEGGKGFEYLTSNLTSGRILHAARSIGLAQAAYEAALKYAQERVQFGRKIGKFQAIRFKLADMATELEAARLLVYRAAWLYDEGKECMKEASMAKLYASEAAERITYQAVQIHGGYGYMAEFPVERYFRDARLYTVTEGTSEIQKVIIARQIGL